MKCSHLYQIFLIGILVLLTPLYVWSAEDPPKDDPFYLPTIGFPEAVMINPNTIYIPFSLAGRLITVEARVDTFQGNFLLDTGAERLLLNRRYFGRPGHVSASVSAVGNTGQVLDVDKHWIDTLHWDNLFFKNVQTNIVDLSHIERKKHLQIIGIIGYDVFRDFEIFLDFQLMQIVLTRLDRRGYRIDSTAIWETPIDSVDFKLAKHFVVLKGKVGETNLRFGLDSGAELNLIDRRVKRKVFDQFDIVKRVRMLGAGQNTIEVVAGSLRDVYIGQQHTDSMRTLITSLSDMNLNFGIRLDGVLGYEFLSTRRTLINYKRKKLYFFAFQRP